MSQETQITPETALANLITVYKQARLTPDEHDIMRASIQTIVDLIQKEATKAPKKGN